MHHNRGIDNLKGEPYHPPTNGATERLVQTFKQSLKKSSSTPHAAFQLFLMQYYRMPLPFAYSPTELLNGWQIPTKIDTLLLLPVHKAQEYHASEATKSQTLSKVKPAYSVGGPCCALHCGPRHDKVPRWIPATVVKLFGSKSIHVRVHPRGQIWRRHLEQTTSSIQCRT